jgi:TPP-dependent indolepyruvate ferredoxin oxidoreductase alpha subunit
VLLCVEKYVTVLSSFGDFNEEDLKLARRLVVNRPIAMSLQEEFSERLENSPVVATVWGFVEQQVTRAMKELFAPLATLKATEADWRTAFEALEEGGIFGLLDHDGELTRALAAIGLANTISTNINVIQLICKVLDVDEGAVARAMSLSPRCGLSLVARNGESVVALV